MPKLTGAELLRETGTEHPPQRCFLCGEDTLAVAQLEKRMLKKLTDGDALSSTVFDGQALDLDRLADACSFCPMLQPYNVIVIRDLDAELLSAADADTLLEILRGLPDCAVVIVSMRTLPAYEIRRGAPSVLPKYKKLWTFFEKEGVLCLCEKKNALTLGKQIAEQAKRSGSEISRADAELLASRCLCDSTLIQTELTKLLACADGGPITREMLEDLTAALPDADAFRMARAVTGGNGAEALRLLRDLTARSEDTKTILGLLSILSAAFTDLYRAKLAMGSAKQAEQVVSDFGYQKNREFAVKNAMRDAVRPTLPQLRTCIRILRQTDRNCKSSRTAPRLLLEQAIVRMLRVRRDGSEAST